jgi:hypothetical protein
MRADKNDGKIQTGFTGLIRMKRKINPLRPILINPVNPV